MEQVDRQFVLANFLEHEGPQTLLGLGRLTGLDPSTIHRDLAGLMDEGVVKREEIEGWRSRSSPKTGRFIYRIAEEHL